MDPAVRDSFDQVINQLVHGFLIVSVIVLIFLAVGIYMVSKKRYVKNSLLTPNELRFYKVLTKAVGGDYEVTCQVRLANLIKISNNFFSWNDFFKIGAKCVDFVLFDRKTGNTLLVIELDDSSHRRLDRIKRDRFVNQVLEEAGVPLLRITASGWYEEKDIKERIQMSLT